MAHEKSTVDEALQLLKGRDFEKALGALLDNDADVVLAMIDLDSFMTVNQKFGREEGDRVLIETGEYLKGFARENVTLYRFGGDQFALLYADGTEKEEAFLQMEEMRRGYAVVLPDGSAQTISIGIAASQDDGALYYELVRRADGAMFRAKLSGHNRVCFAREEKMVTKTSHYTQEQLKRLTRVSQREGIGEAIMLREALDILLKKYDG